jgi:hypothetical protein
MSTPYDISSLSLKELSALHDLARRRAQELRREAIGDFWRGAHAVLAAAADAAGRSARRLAQPLARHGRGRPEPAEAVPMSCKGV